MLLTDELKPRDRAPVSGWYELLNVFGTPTGEAVFVTQGYPVPAAPRRYVWRLKTATHDTAQNDQAGKPAKRFCV